MQQVLILQKPSRTSKTRDHIKHLKRRMELWKAGNITEILQEGRCIQNHLSRSRKHCDKAALARSFQRLISTAKVNNALTLLSSSSTSGVLDLDEIIPDPFSNNPPRTTRDILIEINILRENGHELSGCVRAETYNLILIFASYYYAPYPCMVLFILRMIRERHVILKASLRIRLAV